MKWPLQTPYGVIEKTTWDEYIMQIPGVRLYENGDTSIFPVLDVHPESLQFRIDDVRNAVKGSSSLIVYHPSRPVEYSICALAGELLFRYGSDRRGKYIIIDAKDIYLLPDPTTAFRTFYRSVDGVLSYTDVCLRPGFGLITRSAEDRNGEAT